VDAITYVGHATLRIEQGDLRLLTDPLLTARVGHLGRTSPTPDTTGWNIDAVLISHLHADHLHLPSLRRLQPAPRLLAPRGAAAYLSRHGFTNVVETAPGEVVTIKGVAIETTPADHAGRHMPGRPHTAAVGYIIHGPRPVYFAGDTDLFAGMAAIGAKSDVALVPVWGWGPTLGPGHLNPYRAAQALELLRPSLAIPIHWGTYFPIGLRPFLPRLLSHPPRTFARYAAAFTPEVRVAVLNPGEGLALG